MLFRQPRLNNVLRFAHVQLQKLLHCRGFLVICQCLPPSNGARTSAVARVPPAAESPSRPANVPPASTCLLTPPAGRAGVTVRMVAMQASAQRHVAQYLEFAKL